MNKQEFLDELTKKLKGLPKEDIDEKISFYSEMIDDKIEDGKSEAQAIVEIGSTDDVVAEIASTTPLHKLMKQKMTPKRKLKIFEIILIILGSPVWIPILAICLILFLVSYFILWILEFALYVVEGSLIVGGFGSIIMFFISLADKPTVLYLAYGFMGLGVAGFFLLLCIVSTKGVIILSKKYAIAIKSWFIRGGKNE